MKLERDNRKGARQKAWFQGVSLMSSSGCRGVIWFYDDNLCSVKSFRIDLQAMHIEKCGSRIPVILVVLRL
jgi:hypothetical protein